MNRYLNTILISSFLLLVFPFLGFPELWENIYVAVIAFVIGYTSMLLRHKCGLVKENHAESSLQDYVKELQDKFAKKETITHSEKKKTRLADINLAAKGDE